MASRASGIAGIGIGIITDTFVRLGTIFLMCAISVNAGTPNDSNSASHHLSNVASILLIFFRSRTITFYLIYRLDRYVVAVLIRPLLILRSYPYHYQAPATSAHDEPPYSGHILKGQHLAAAKEGSLLDEARLPSQR